MASETIFDSDFGEKGWVDQISGALVAETTNIPISIFNVPKTLNPDSYIPKAIALGPYHHFEPQLYQLERYKVAAVKSFLKPDQIHDFKTLVIDKLKENDSAFRASYHKYIDFDDTTLAWVFAVDGFFLLRILSNYAVSSTTNRKLTQQSLLCRDALLLENQVPFVVLNQLREMVNLSSPKDDNELVSTIIEFCKEQSPLPITTAQPKTNLHFLDVMYHLIVNGTATNQESSVAINVTSSVAEDANIGNLTENLEEIVELGGKVLQPLQVLENLPWQKIFNLLGIKSVEGVAEDTQPLNVEITIPSVSYLNKIGGINFGPAKGGISDIKFVEKEVTFYLPVLNLNTNSEAIIRNLVAYEAATAESTPALAQYIGVMNGIIDAAEDADILKENGVITGNLTGDEIVNFFNGMNDVSGRKGSKTIDDINAYFSKRPRVKVYNLVRKRIYNSWKFLTVFTTIVLILLMVMQSFCDVYGCTKFWDRN